MKPLFTILAYLTAEAALAAGAISFFIRLHNNLLRLDVYAPLDNHVCRLWNTEDALLAFKSSHEFGWIKAASQTLGSYIRCPAGGLTRNYLN
ncbi:MAG TPA: hypothetical protein VF141_18135 [Chryseolinea sp.]